MRRARGGDELRVIQGKGHVVCVRATLVCACTCVVVVVVVFVVVEEKSPHHRRDGRYVQRLVQLHQPHEPYHLTLLGFLLVPPYYLLGCPTPHLLCESL